MPKKFILNDESVLNSHGFYILNAGGIFDRFNDNPVMLDAHDSDSCLDVIGRWGVLSVEGKQLLSTPEFDMEDPEAAKISGKVDRGYVKGASMGIYILEAELREMPGMGLYPVVTKWELLEASPVPVPSNKASLRLYANDRKTVLKAEQISLSLDSIIKPKQNMEKITLSADAAKVLGLGKEPEATDLNAAIMELSARELAAVAAKNKAEKELSDHHTAEATSLVELAVKEGRITAEKKESFVKMAVADLQQAKDVIAALPAKETFSDKTKTGSKDIAGREEWSYMRWLKEDSKGLKLMQANEPEKFAKLKDGYKRS